VRWSRPAAYAPGSRGTPNHSMTYGVEHAVSAIRPIQLKQATARRTEAGHRSPPWALFAQRLKARPMSAIVEKAQKAE
jgi:hypothetical protein